MPPRALTRAGSSSSTSPPGRRRSRSSLPTRRRTGRGRGTRGRSIRSRPGSCFSLSGAATRLQPQFVGLPKRYETEIDLTARTTTGDVEGERRRRRTSRPPRTSSSRARRPPRGGRAADSGGLGREDRRRARVRAPSPRGRRRDARSHDARRTSSSSSATRTASRGSSCSSPRARTSARSPRRSEVTASSLRDGDRAVPRRRGRPGADHPARRGAREAPVKVVRDPRSSSRDRAPSRSGASTASTAGIARGRRGACDRARADGDHFDPHPRIALGNKVELLTTLDRRLELLRRRASATSLVAAFTRQLQQLTPEEFAERYLRAIGVEAVVAGEDFRFGVRRSGDLALLERLGFEVVVGAASFRACRRRRSGARSRAGDVRARRRCSGGRSSSTASSSPATSVAAHSATRPRTSRLEPDLACPRYGIYAGFGARAPGRDLDRDESALRRHGAPDRAVPPRLRRRSLRKAARRRALGAAPRRSGVRERGRARGADRPRVEATKAARRP